MCFLEKRANVIGRPEVLNRPFVPPSSENRRRNGGPVVNINRTQNLKADIVVEGSDAFCRGDVLPYSLVPQQTRDKKKGKRPSFRHESRLEPLKVDAGTGQ